MKRTDSRDAPRPARYSLAVGIPSCGGWKETFLQYAGLPRVRLSSISEGVAQGIRVFLWNRPDPFFQENDGTRIAVVTENGFLKGLLGQESTRGEGYAFRVAGGGPFSERSFYIQRPCERLPTPPGQVVGACLDADGRPLDRSGIVLYEQGNIFFLSVPWNVLDEQMGARWAFRPFYSPFLGKHFAETGPTIDYGAMRRLFLELVLHAFHRIGLPLIRLRHPFSGKKAFCFRIDADGFSRESTEAVLTISKGIGGATFSWFIDVQGWDRNLVHVRELIARNQEVELHCYHHMTYRRERVNRANLKRGLRRLERLGVRPRGTASPYGFWFEGYQEAVRRLGFAYSSEFAFNTDDLPSFPYNDSTYPLQVPFHPGSIGVFEKVPFSRQEIFTHLRETAEKAIRDAGCALLCDHPVGRIERYEREFLDLFQGFLEEGCTCVPVSEYADRSRAFLLEAFHPVAVDHAIRIEGACSGDASFEVVPPPGRAFEVVGARPFVVHPALDLVEDNFACPPREAFERYLREHAKDERLTHLTWFQWHRGLARYHLHRLRRDLLRGRRRSPR